MTSFSKRYGYIPVRTAIQVDDLDEQTRIAIWNEISQYVFYLLDPGEIDSIFRFIWSECMGKTIDSYNSIHDIIGNRDSQLYNNWRLMFLKEFSFFALFDSLEIIANFLRKFKKRYLEGYIDRLNYVFEKYLVGFRFIDNQITKITDEIEIESIDSVISSPIEEVKTHSRKALIFYSNRQNPDYKNSIKESISALEVCVRYITNKPSATLTTCVKELKRNGKLHHAFAESIEKLYAYCGDAGGIRHAEKPGDSLVPPDANQAKFILITCSAMINYLLPMKKSPTETAG